MTGYYYPLAQVAVGLRYSLGALVLENRRSIRSNAREEVPEFQCAVKCVRQVAALILRHRCGGLRREAYGGESEGGGYGQGAEVLTRSCCLHMRFLSAWVRFFSNCCRGCVPCHPYEAEEPWGCLFARIPSSPIAQRYARSVHVLTLLCSVAECLLLVTFKA